MELSRSSTVVVADDGLDGSLVHELAGHWFDQNLLEGFAWVRPSQVTRSVLGPAAVRAQLPGVEGEVDLLEHISSRRLDLVRVVVLQVLAHGGATAERLVQTCDEVARLVRRAMPGSPVAGSSAPMRLVRVNLLVPETDLAAQDLCLLQPGWEVNAVVSPEDRPDLDRMSVLVRAETNLHGHALAAAATVGGLWRGMGPGPFDTDELDSTTGERDVVVLRCQVRAVVSDDRADRLGHAVVDSVLSSPDETTGRLSWGFTTDRPEELATSALHRLLTTPGWRQDTRDRRPLAKEERSLRQLVRGWLTFQAHIPVQGARLLGSRAVRAVEGTVTTAVVGAEAGVVGRFAPLSPAAAYTRAAEQIRGVERTLEGRRDTQRSAGWGQTTPEAWRTLRELAVGLVDGSPLPHGFVRHERSGLDEVLPPSYVVPDPADTLTVGAQLVRAVDVRRADELLQGPAEPTGEPDTDADHAPDAAEPAETVDHDVVASWVERRRASLLWRLSSTVHDRLRAEDANARMAQERIEANADAPGAQRLTSSRRFLVGCWGAALLGAAVTSLWWTDLLPSLLAGALPPQTWLHLAVAVMVLLLVVLVGGHAYYRALFAYEWEVRCRIVALQEAHQECVAARFQEQRWQVMYQGVLDWADILAEVLHRPWRRQPAVETPALTHERLGLPAAVAVAHPASNAAPSRALVAAATERVCRRGWLARELHRCVERASAVASSRQPALGDLAADLDPGLRGSGPRADLLRVARSGRLKDAAAREVTQGLLDDLGRGDLPLPDVDVVRVGAFSDGEVGPGRAFLAGSQDLLIPLVNDLFTDVASVRGCNVPASSRFTLPHGVPLPAVPHARVQTHAASLSTRVDVSERVPAESLVMFARKPRLHAVPTPDADRLDAFN